MDGRGKIFASVVKLLDSRRLRGRGLDLDVPAAIAEVALDPHESAEPFVAAWRGALLRMTKELRRPELAESAASRVWPGGVSLLVPAPIDVLLAAADLNEWAIDAAARELRGSRAAGLTTGARKLARRFREESRPPLVELERAARERDVPFLWDDERVTLGYAAHSREWPVDALPRAEDVDWSALRRIPVALITGTNGKTTTTRLLARMVKLAGLVPGHTSSDGVAVDERVVEAGDWTGAEAARLVLRRPEVQVAILETARGGILRRGLAVDRADAAIITNVAADHLGENGVADLETMARVKAVCARAVPASGHVVLNAGDERLRALAPSLAAPVVWIAREPSPFVLAELAAGHRTFVREGNELVHFSTGGRDVLARVGDVPLTFAGAAPHNVENVLGAAALAWSLGLPRQAIVEALRTFGASPSDNPGRGTVVDLGGGVRGLFDFGHNAAGMAQLYPLARALASGGRITHVATLAGDRSDQDFAAFAREIVAGGAGRAVIWETETLLRGRAVGEPRRLLRAALTEAGLPAGAIADAPTEREAVQIAREHSASGDLIVVAPSLDRAPSSMAISGFGEIAGVSE